MSAVLRARKVGVTNSTTTAVAIDVLPVVEFHRITNRLYSAPAMTCGDLLWRWEAQCPSRIEQWVTLAAADARIHVALDGDAIGLDAELFDWRSFTGDTRLLAWTARHEPLLELLRGAFHCNWVPQCLGDCDSPARPSSLRAGFSVFRADGFCVVTGVADFDASLVRCAPRATADIAGAAALAWQRVPARLPMIVDEVEMARFELASVGSGCILRLDNKTLATKRPRVSIGAGSVRLIVDVHDLQATVVGFAAATPGLEQSTSGGIDMSDESPTAAADSAQTAAASTRGIDAATLPVRLTFSAGRLIRPFGDLSGIAPGYVFELDKRLDDQSIAISANDVLIALGELVCVGDLVGIRVTRMLARV